MANLLNIGKTGLFASKKSLETTGHNISNANTEGYSRQRVVQTTGVPVTQSGLIQGTGARVKAINRVSDDYVEKKLERSITSNSYFEQRAEQLEQVEHIFNELDSEGLNQVLNRFFNSFRELANQPENETIRSLVRESASIVVKDFKRIRSTLDRISEGIDLKLEQDVETINYIADKLARLNKKIAELEAGGQETGDLRDQRDLSVRELSEFFGVTTYVDEKGLFNVAAKGVGTIVSGGETQPLLIGNLSEERSSNGMPNSAEIYFKGRSSHYITHKFRGGKIEALHKVRNEDIFKLQQDIDKIAYDFMNSVNAIHRRGFVNRPLKTTLDGGVESFDEKGPTSGINFFEEPMQKKGAALNISMSQEVLADLSNISTALIPNGPGDNRIAVAISKLQHEKIMSEGTATLEEGFLETIGQVGLQTSKAQLDAEQSEGILAQAKNLRERISGVSLDEETANLVRYQHAYDASAKVMQTADEMFQTVLGIKR